MDNIFPHIKSIVSKQSAFYQKLYFFLIEDTIPTAFFNYIAQYFYIMAKKNFGM